jgi:hypothetical protein
LSFSLALLVCAVNAPSPVFRIEFNQLLLVLPPPPPVLLVVGLSSPNSAALMSSTYSSFTVNLQG